MKSMATPTANGCPENDGGLKPAVSTATTRRTFVLALASAGLVGCGAEQSWTFRYQLKIRLRAEGRVYEGSSVFQTIYRRVPETSLNQTGPFYARAWGEAVAIDLGARGLFIGLLGSVAGIEANHFFSPVTSRTLVQLLPNDMSTGDSFRSGAAFDAVRQLEGERDVLAGSWPLFAHLSEAGNPATARFVPVEGQRYRLTSNTSSAPLSAALGMSADIERVTIEITNRPTTRRIEQLCPWVSEMPGARGGYYRGGGHQQPFGERLVYRNLRMEGLTR